MKESTKNSIILTWTPPTEDGGAEITNYILEFKPEDSIRWKRVTEDKIRTPTYTVKGLEPGKKYDFRVAAENKAGAGPTAESVQSIKAEDKIGQYQK